MSSSTSYYTECGAKHVLLFFSFLVLQLVEINPYKVKGFYQVLLDLLETSIHFIKLANEHSCSVSYLTPQIFETYKCLK